jgi:hypothetical protein
MKTGSKSVIVGGENWIHWLYGNFGKEMNSNPEVCLWYAVGDIIQQSRGSWVVDQINSQISGINIDVMKMESEVYSWRFYGDKVIILQNWNLFSVCKTNLKSLLGLIDLQSKMIYDDCKPFDVKIKIFDFDYRSRPDIEEFDEKTGCRI